MFKKNVKMKMIGIILDWDMYPHMSSETLPLAVQFLQIAYFHPSLQCVRIPMFESKKNQLQELFDGLLNNYPRPQTPAFFLF